MLKFLKNRRVLIIVAVGLVALFLIYRNATAANIKVATAKVTRQILSETLSFSGKIAADEDVNLRFQTSGYLNWVGVKQGDYVKKYQILASLDKRSVQKTLEKYLTAYKKNRNTFDQIKDNDKNQELTDVLRRTLENSQMDLNSSVMDVEIQNLSLEFSNLWTPIEGLVISVDSPNAGVNIIPASANFEVINPKTVFFLATADQSDVVKLTASQSAIITLDSFTDQPINTSIRDIAFVPKTGETGTVYEVKLGLPVDNSSYKYRVGMTGDVSFVTREIPNALALPTKFIKTNADGTKYVWLKEKDAKTKHIVTIGDAFDTMTQINSGLTEGDTVFDQ